MGYLSLFLKGIAIGVGNIAPGVSGGALAMIFGIYEKLVDSVGNFFRDMKKNTLFLIPVGLGAAIGIIGFSKILTILLDTVPMQTTYTFAGLIVGTLPLLFKRANKKGFKKSYIIPFLITLLIALSFVFMEAGFFSNIQSGGKDSVGLFTLIIGGFVLAGSLVIPGVSGSVLLMLIGFYADFLEAVSTLDLAILFPMGIGLGAGVLFFSKLMDYLLKEHYGVTYYAVLGFVIGAIPEVITGYSLDLVGLISVLFFFAGLAVSLSLSKLEKKQL